MSVPATAGGDVRTDSAFQIWQGTALERYRVSSADRAVQRQRDAREPLRPEPAGGDAAARGGARKAARGERSARSAPSGRTSGSCCTPGATSAAPPGRARHHRHPRHPRQQRAVVHLVAEPLPRAPARGEGPSAATRRAIGTTCGPATSSSSSTGGAEPPSTCRATAPGRSTTRLFARIYASREPFWTQMSRGGTDYRVYLENDRSGIYALGYPVIPAIGHLINLAELTVLAALGLSWGCWRGRRCSGPSAPGGFDRAARCSARFARASTASSSSRSWRSRWCRSSRSRSSRASTSPTVSGTTSSRRRTRRR